jgi:outer membrane biosynthesis protein TonB
MLYAQPSLSKKTKFIILLIIILLHLLFLIFFVGSEFNFLPTSPLGQKVKELHKKVHKQEPEEEQWATLKSRAMQMSAPVILVDDPADNDGTAKNTESEQTASQDTTDTHSEDVLKPDSADTDTIKKEEPQEPIQAAAVDIPRTEDTSLIQQKIEEQITVSSSVLPHSPPSSSVDDKKAPSQQVQKKRSAPTKPRKNMNAQKTPSRGASHQRASKLSLAQLAQGFVDHMQHEGDYTISMSGHANAKATESQLRIGRFLQRIIGSIQSSWKANLQRYPLSYAVVVSIHFTIVINKNGTLNKVGIDKSSGNPSIDNYIKLIIQDASTSFPSIPDYMSHDICSIRCTLDDIKLPEGPPGYTIK